MNDKKQTGKRFPIRKRVLYAILGITLVMMTVALITSMYYMNQMIRESETMLSAQLSRNLSREVELKALHTETKFESYIRIMEILRHYAEHMYQDHDRLVESGKFVDTSRASTGEGVYALQSAFASEDYDLERFHDEMYFFSHLEYLMEPIAKENDGIDISIDSDKEVPIRDYVHLSSEEIGDMAFRLNEMVEQLKETIRDLGKAEERADRMHELANRDALTSVKNKTAFDSYMKSIQDELEQVDEIDFAVILFDCDDLKQINDRYGHDKGDEYLKNASSLICSTFKHSPVFRFGGDEFTVGLQGSDFTIREELINLFRMEQEAISRREKDPWKQVHVSLGTATYDPEKDRNIYDTLHRADMIMYEDKEARKENSWQLAGSGGMTGTFPGKII